MNHPWGPRTSGESKPESPVLTLVHQISRYGLHHKKKEVSLSLEKKRGETSTNIIYNTTPPKTHKQDLRLFRCELSKVA